jgi:hypothetical protein
MTASWAEDVTITTYYPAPGGSFNTLRVNQLSVGVDYRDDTIPTNGAIIQGNVGIGITSPASAMQVEKNINATSWANMFTQGPFASQVILSDQGAGRFYIGNYYLPGVNTAAVLQASDYWSNTDHWRLILLNPNGGDVGINSTNPQTKLEVVETTVGVPRGISSVQLSDNIQGGILSLIKKRTSGGALAGDYAGGLDFVYYNAADQYRNNAYIWSRILDPTPGSEDGSLQFATVNNGIMNVNMYIRNDGCVGIGTTTPGAGLHIRGLSGTGHFESGIFFEDTGNPLRRYSMYVNPDRHLVIADEANISGRLFIKPGSATNSFVMIDGSNGCVGLNMLNPPHALSIHQPNSSGISLSSDSEAYQQYIDLMTRDLNHDGIFQNGDMGWHFACRSESWTNAAQAGDLMISRFDQAGWINVMTFDRAVYNVGGTNYHFVGIYNHEPQYMFQVKDAYCDGTVWKDVSTVRLKEEIQSLSHALDKIMSLQGVSFRWKESQKKDIGFIGEEVAKVIPEVVDLEKDGKFATGLSYGHLTALLTEAIKEQQKEIEALKTRIANLEKHR